MRPVDVDRGVEAPRVPRHRARIGHGRPSVCVHVDRHLMPLMVEVDTHQGLSRAAHATAGRRTRVYAGVRHCLST